MTEHISKIPAGLRYYFGARAQLRRAVEDCAMSVFNGWSYEDIITPSVDYYSLFEHGMGAEASQAFRFTDGDGRMLALRPDVTSSVARAAATLLAEHERPLRLCYSATVFRQRPQTHRASRRESTQLGCELLGVGGTRADTEVLVIAAETLKRQKLDDGCAITLNNVEVFNGVAERLGLDDGSREKMRALIDMRDSAELRRFLSDCGTSAAEQDAFARLIQLSGKVEVIKEARRFITNPRSAAALAELEDIWGILAALDLSEHFEIDFGDVSELDYYTGLVFKIYVRGAGGRVGLGGRYDRLTAKFGRAEPAIGFALDLDTLTEVATLGSVNTLSKSTPDSMIVRGDGVIESFQEATRRRARGERVALQL